MNRFIVTLLLLVSLSQRAYCFDNQCNKDSIIGHKIESWLISVGYTNRNYIAELENTTTYSHYLSAEISRLFHLHKHFGLQTHAGAVANLMNIEIYNELYHTLRKHKFNLYGLAADIDIAYITGSQKLSLFTGPAIEYYLTSTCKTTFDTQFTLPEGYIPPTAFGDMGLLNKSVLYWRMGMNARIDRFHLGWIIAFNATDPSKKRQVDLSMSYLDLTLSIGYYF